ncbi:hypothetical protein Q4563_20015, partial [Gilvimarinus sp. 1_MG-2023]|nr:hypothetical protein [Gilvimarinus sp. 1_MG-2023]
VDAVSALVEPVHIRMDTGFDIGEGLVIPGCPQGTDISLGKALVSAFKVIWKRHVFFTGRVALFLMPVDHGISDVIKALALAGTEVENTA